MKYIYCFILTISLGVHVTNAQKKWIVQYQYTLSSELKDSMAFDILRPAYSGLMTTPDNFFFNKTILEYHHNNNLATTTCSYDCNDTSSAYLFDGIGHYIFVIPGDTVIIHIQNKINVADSPHHFYNYQIQYEGRNASSYAIFDSLENIGGDMRLPNISLVQAKYNIDTLYAMTKQLFEQRKSFLKLYSEKNKIPLTIQKLANAEIYASFYFTLFENDSAINYLTKNKNNTYNPYFTTFDSPNFNDPYIYFNTNLSQLAASSYWVSKSKLETGYEALYTNVGLKNIYEDIKEKKMDSRIKNHLLAEMLVWSVKFKLDCYDSLVQNFFQFCNNNGYKSFLTETILEEKQKEKNEKVYSLYDAMDALVVPYNGKAIKLNNIFYKNKYVLIDCWASWCAPCLKELPYGFNLAKKYKNKIDWIYLSFDRDTSAWKKKSKLLNLKTKSFILEQQFKSAFALHFGINSIPRYLLFSPKGKPIQINLPRPSREKEIENILNNLL